MPIYRKLLPSLPPGHLAVVDALALELAKPTLRGPQVYEEEVQPAEVVVQVVMPQMSGVPRADRERVILAAYALAGRDAKNVRAARGYTIEEAAQARLAERYKPEEKPCPEPTSVFDKR